MGEIAEDAIIEGDRDVVMAEPDWDRWHELRDILYGRGFTEAEQAEYDAFLPIVARLDAAEAAIGKAAIDKLTARHEDSLRRLTGIRGSVRI